MALNRDVALFKTVLITCFTERTKRKGIRETEETTNSIKTIKKNPKKISEF